MKGETDPDDLSMLPESPGPEEIASAYHLCRKKLGRANQSRSALKGHDDYRLDLIANLQEQLLDLENSLREEAVARVRVHELNARVTEIVGDLEAGLDEAATIVEEKGGRGLTAWVVRIARLVHVVQRLRQVKARALRLLGGDSPPVTEELPWPKVESAPPQLPAAVTPPEASTPEAVEKTYGPLLLQWIDDAYGVLVLHTRGQAIPDGLSVDRNSPFLLGEELLVPEDPEDPDFAAIEAGILALESDSPVVPELGPWIQRGLLPFALDTSIGLLRLIHLDEIDSASHLLVRQELAAALEEQEVGSPVSLELDDEDLWRGFQFSPDELAEALQIVTGKPDRIREFGPRLSARGGVRMLDGQGYLATGLGLPLLGVPLPLMPEQVRLTLSDGSTLTYEQVNGSDPTAERQLWQPSVQERRRPELPVGIARFTAAASDGCEMERAIQLSSLPTRVRFQRSQPLDYREDWGLTLGPLELTQPFRPEVEPSADSLQWAQHRLHQVDLNVNHLFEQQMLESLSALFQRRAAVPRRDFFQLYAQLRNKPDEWPGFPDAVLRGWCEGGWIEEGVQRGTGRWRIQPVDPRLVHLDDGGFQLVGLLPARGLMAVLATARQLGLQVKSVSPACADMPRGWRFYGEMEGFGSACGLPVVEQGDWVPDPTTHDWMLDGPLQSDSPPWATGQASRPASDAICGRRGLDQHWKPAQPLPEGGRAPIGLQIEAETSRYGKRRWHSNDPVSEQVFSSCHRNRVALHALVVATNGWWPFGFTNWEAGQLDRIYDADAYLPLPIGRHAALTGARMPGPTRHQPRDHTYRYHVDLSFRAAQSMSQFLPLTPLA